MGWITDIGIKIFSWFFNDKLEQLKFKKRFKIIVNQDESFTTIFKGENYTVIKLKLINNNDFDVKSLSFETEPKSTLVDNLWKPPSIGGSSCIDIVGGLRLISDSFGCKPVMVEKRDSNSGNLIFKTDKQLKQLIVSYQDKKITVKLKDVKNTKTF